MTAGTEGSRGYGWRIRNRIVRTDLRRAARLTAAFVRGGRADRPLLVFGVPRSGTTTVFQMLRGSAEVGGPPHEGHDIWRTFQHPRWSNWSSDVVASGQLRPAERRYVTAQFDSWTDAPRFLDKTPESALRLGYLADLFPDARLLAVHRSPPEVLSSIIRGWRQPDARYRSYYVPADLSIVDHPHRHLWCFALIPQWRELRSATIPDIAMAQWEHYVDAIAAGRQRFRDRWTDIYLEDVRANPTATMRQLATAAEIDCTPSMLTTASRLAVDATNALAPHAAEKWRNLPDADAVTLLLPRLAARAPLLGYDVDPDTGLVTRRPVD